MEQTNLITTFKGYATQPSAIFSRVLSQELLEVKNALSSGITILTIAVKVTSQKRETNRSWRMDETYIKVKGEWGYLYRADLIL
jgi:hypothetical protein